MNESNSSISTLLGAALLDAVRQTVTEVLQAAGNEHSTTELLTTDELAAKLKVPRSWVYEQSRQGKIPTHRLGRYIRFDLTQVLASQKKD